jgi:hypothetical protein
MNGVVILPKTDAVVSRQFCKKARGSFEAVSVCRLRQNLPFSADRILPFSAVWSIIKINYFSKSFCLKKIGESKKIVLKKIDYA